MAAVCADDPLDQALGAGAAATIRAARVAGTHAPSARAGVYAHAVVSARPCPPTETPPPFAGKMKWNEYDDFNTAET